MGGTGFLFSQRILNESHGWRFYLLTEDIEFSVYHILRGEKIAICESAVLYDEQPTDFRQSCRQRLRWAKGYVQVFLRYGGQLLRGAARAAGAALICPCPSCRSSSSPLCACWPTSR